MRDGVADIRHHAVEREGFEIAPAHFNDGTEAAIERASAGGLDDVNLAADKRIAFKHTDITSGRFDFAFIQPCDRAVRVVDKLISATKTETGDSVAAPLLLDCSQQLSESQLTFPAYDEIDAGRQVGVSLRRQAGVIAPNDNANRGVKGTHQLNDLQCRLALECHNRKPDDIRREFAN